VCRLTRRNQHGSNNELSAPLNSHLSIFDAHDRSHADHNIRPIVLFTERMHVLHGLWGREGEFADLEATLNGCCHGRRTSSRGGSSEDRCCTVESKVVENLLKVLLCLGLLLRMIARG